MARPRCSRNDPNRYGLIDAIWRSESIATRVAPSPCAIANRPIVEVAARARPAWLASFKNCLLDTPAVMACLTEFALVVLLGTKELEFSRKGILRHFWMGR